jgi:alkyl sulfatase BDS1-like metallo-beta-lactamase superfamily hydrolase
MRRIKYWLFALPVLFTGSVGLAQDSAMSIKPASAATKMAQERTRESLPADDGQDEAFAERGFIATIEDPLIKAEDGHVIWDAAKFDWVTGDAPPTVNPSLWRLTSILKHHGLFKVRDRVWQVRGIDAANMLVIQGDTGWIIIDPLMTTETASAALNLVNTYLGKRPVKAVIYGHSHPDHFGGVKGVVDPENNPTVIAPAKFMESVVGEYAIAGHAMSRRVSYQFGMDLQPNPQGHVGGGIVIESADGGTVTLIPPTDSIENTGDERIIDGVRFQFQMVPETEAPSEMNFYLPELKTLYISEIVSCTMHNIQTPRGALVRDALKWADFITEAIDLYGDQAENLVTGHCWPRFGNDTIKHYLALQRDNYKFIHDQTMRLINQGGTPTEVARDLVIPDAISDSWANHGYYGTKGHNAKGVFQRYMGWWDGIPAHLNMHTAVEQGERYVAAMGAERIMEVAQKAMQDGDYRWAAEILNHLVFAEPENEAAQALLADTYEQMGYQAESAITRNIYLTGALELRGGPKLKMELASRDLVNAMSTEQFLDMMATRLDPKKIGDRSMTVAINLVDRDEQALISVNNAVLVGQMGKTVEKPSVSVSGPRGMLMALFLQKAPLSDLEKAGLKVTGSRKELLALQDAMDIPPPDFNIVTP